MLSSFSESTYVFPKIDGNLYKKLLRLRVILSLHLADPYLTVLVLCTDCKNLSSSTSVYSTIATSQLDAFY